MIAQAIDQGLWIYVVAEAAHTNEIRPGRTGQPAVTVKVEWPPRDTLRSRYCRFEDENSEYTSYIVVVLISNAIEFEFSKVSVIGPGKLVLFLVYLIVYPQELLPSRKSISLLKQH